MTNFPQLLKDIGEQGILAKIHRFCLPEVVGDDGAVISVSRDKNLVVTTDILVENVHFSDRTTPPEAVGYRGVTANLSDLAAMGATPLGITVGLTLRNDVTIDWLENLYQGMNQCLKPYQIGILGGDVTRSSVVTIAITALGEVTPNQVIRRNVAKPGDLIIVTGTHGGSRAGLELLLNPELAKNLDDGDCQSLIEYHQKPKPRLDVLKHLPKDTRIAGMDSSDGLADAIIQICQASNVGAKIDRNAITIPKALSQGFSEKKSLEFALYGGEDFELILCLEEKAAQILVRKLGLEAGIIGQITNNLGVILEDNSEKYPSVELILDKGFQHF